MATISMHVDENQAALIRHFAKLSGQSVSDLLRESILSRIEDEYDLKAYDEAMAAYRENPESYTLEQTEKELGLA